VEREVKNMPVGTRVLEAGCGLGQWAFLIAEQGHKVIGIDIAKRAIGVAEDYAAKKGIKNCRFYCADLRAIPLKDKYFDYIFSFGVIEHFKNSGEILSEFFRVLKPGGRVFISVPNIYSFHTVTRPLSQILGIWKFGYERSYSPNSLKRLIRSFGFEICENGIIPGEELFGSWPNYLPLIGKFLYNFLRKVSLFIEKKQDKIGFWSYVIARK
jgi:ubiquinone/menaquinone biosynthesis C-methylase UbiE